MIPNNGECRSQKRTDFELLSESDNANSILILPNKTTIYYSN